MILIEEVPKDSVSEYWTLHWEYLNRDIFPFKTIGGKSANEDWEYYRSKEYRGIFENYMDRYPDKVHLVYFCRKGVRIGCAHYVIYKSEDGKCLLSDFWVLPEYRGNKTGHECYAALKNYVQSDGAKYFEINVSNDRNHKFWQGLGFTDFGSDEGGQPLMRLNV